MKNKITYQIKSNSKMKTNNLNLANLKALLDAFFKAITNAYPGKTINLSQPISNYWAFSDNCSELYLLANLEDENTLTLYATDPAEIEENGLCTNLLHTELGTIIIAEDF